MNKKVIAIAGGVVLLVAGAVGGTLFFTGALGGKGHAPASDHGKADEHKAADAHGGGGGEHGGGGSGATFYALDPSFVVNIDDGNMVRFLQVQVEVRLHDATAMDRIKTFQPRIRNDLIMLLSAQQRDTLRTPEGRQQLQVQVKDAINKVLTEESGSAGVDAVYFTKLVLQ